MPAGGAQPRLEEQTGGKGEAMTITKNMTRAMRFCGWLAVLLVLALSVPQPAAAQTSEQQLLQELQKVQGRVTIPDAKSGVLIQPEGVSWRDFQRDTLPLVGWIAVVGMIVLLAGFYLIRGKVRIKAGFSGRKILRFHAFERFVHWLTASCFIILGLTGLNISFGKSIIQPIIGDGAFSTLTQWGKYAHDYLALPFVIGIVLMLVIWVKDNLPTRLDLVWLKQGGGIIGDKHPPAKKFNAGQKLVFWAVILGGAGMAITGYLLLFPFTATDIDGQQTAAIVHGLIGLVMIGVILAHIYIGTIGMEGAFDAMGTGQVDENWAKEHHSLWVEKKHGQAAKGGVTQPAE